MQIINSITPLRAVLAKENNIAFVPTMGNLHAGHLALVKQAKQQAKCVVVSIFVNPLQFAAGEDLDNYPRTLQEDSEQLNALGVDVLFTPTLSEMYPDFDGQSLNQTMIITPPPIANTLCGASRAGHFEGVATVVMKLFNIVQPNIAIFGKKDFQQLAIIRSLVRQFNLPIDIIGCEIKRDVDGLALSSRNGYLSKTERAEAVRLNQALINATKLVQQGQLPLNVIEQQTAEYLSAHGWLVDYIAIRSAKTLLSPEIDEKSLIVLGAATIGSPRLIDNVEFLR